MKMLVIALLGFASLCCAQTAPTVVALNREDADTVKTVHDELIAAQDHWAHIQKQIGEKYLIVDKGSPDASEHKWYPEGISVFRSWSIIGTGTNFYLSGEAKCETEEEKKDRLAKEVTAREFQEKQDAERESHSRRIRKGFESESDYIFSDDWWYLLKKPEAPSPFIGWRAVGTPGEQGSRWKLAQ